MVDDTFQAFYDPALELPAVSGGPLAGLKFAAKEAFAVQGQVTSGGNPDWLATHTPASETAHVIEALRGAGATLTGKTHTDELMYGLNGENVHYGTPINPMAPDRIPGGSSSGSAVSVAGGLVDFAIGTDTGGSVRIPSSYCGIYGIRPSHGRTNLTGVIPLAQSFDTVGWFTRSPSLLKAIGGVLLEGPSNPGRLRRAIIATDMLDLVDDAVKAPLVEAVHSLASAFPLIRQMEIAPDGLDQWMQAFRILQGYEIWQNFGPWITDVQPRFGPGVQERFLWTGTISAADRDYWRGRVDGWLRILDDILRDDTVVIMPTAPGIAPLRNTPVPILNAFRDRVLRMTALAGLSGAVQVSVPLAQWQGLPMGVSILANRGLDESLLDWIADWAEGHFGPSDKAMDGLLG